MTQPTPQVLQTYTLLQIAAETFLATTKPEDAAAEPGAGAKVNFSLDSQWLKGGNGHSSRMTDQQAIDFAADWEVVKHQPNTATGFSATLFKLKPGRADASKGTSENQYVVSFRSTEFIEDHVRDNQTNALEVKQAGWAFGQIADMQAWWAGVQSQVGAAQVDVTGYSLGGHLAAAFSLLHPNQVGQVFTFNGAGVGQVKQGDLASVIAGFAQRREAGRNAGLFSDPVARGSRRPGASKRGARISVSDRRQVQALRADRRLA
jgi:pimeloyl-ACP methyl ester carboxylesterase